MNKELKKIVAIIIMISIVVSLLSAKAICVESVEKQYCSATINEEFADNEILIVIMPSNNSTQYTIESFSEINCIAIKELTRNITENELCRILKLTIEGNSKQNVLDAIGILEERNDIYSAEPNYIFSVSEEPDDVHYVSDDQWAIDAIGLNYAWEYTTGSSSIKVGIVDTGIDASHPDLDGRVNISLSTSFNDTSLVDIKGHGTHVAGIIGAIGNNTKGITGVCWNVELVSLKAVDENGTFSYDLIIDAIDYATDNNIDVINCSFGLYISSPAYDGIVHSQRVALNNYNGLAVCSAGNNGKNINTNEHIMSNHNILPNVISVGSSSYSETDGIVPSSFSNFGNPAVDIFAPGESILSTYPTALCSEHSANLDAHHALGYHKLSGTSMAAPYVAGVAALMLSVNSTLSGKELKSLIIRSNNPSEEFKDLCKSGAHLDAAWAVYAAKVYATADDSFYSFYSPFDEDLHEMYYNVCENDIDCGNPDLCESIDGCEDCGYDCWRYLVERHNYVEISHTSSNHILMCAECEYTLTIAHNLCYGADNNSHYQICTDCSYVSTNSNDHIMEFTKEITNSGVNTTQHIATCIECSHSHKTDHTYSYVNENSTSHTARCTGCGYSYVETHSWITRVDTRFCSKCKRTDSSFIEQQKKKPIVDATNEDVAE